MSERKAENRGKGLEEEDLGLIFPEPETEPSNSRPTMAPALRDYKKAAAADDDEIQSSNEVDANLQSSIPEDVPPAFEEPWPDPPEEMKMETVSNSETREQEVQDFAEKVSGTMISSAAEEKLPILKGVSGELLPSDGTWIETIKEIFRPAGPWGLSAPRLRGLVRPSIEGQTNATNMD